MPTDTETELESDPSCCSCTPADTAWATISRAAWRHNLQRVRALAPTSRVWVVIKADAYGHGALEAANTLADLGDGFAVARVDEALALRAAGVTQPILVLAGAADDDELRQATHHQVQLAVHHDHQLAALQRTGCQPRCWIKVDSGMHRLGFAPARIAAVHAQLTLLTGHPVGMMTHFACADDADTRLTDAQISCFDAAVTGLPGPQAMANSAGILCYPASHRDWVRPGIMLYGGAPLIGHAAAEHGLLPVMTLRSRVIAVREVAAGEPVGYGQSWRTPVATRTAVVAIGYGDGYPRHAPSGTPVLIHGVRYSLAGRVSMDLITVNIGDAPVAVGDEAILWGDGLPVDEIAGLCGTIGYALLCGVSPRVRRVYRD